MLNINSNTEDPVWIVKNALAIEFKTLINNSYLILAWKEVNWSSFFFFNFFLNAVVINKYYLSKAFYILYF